MSKEEYIRIPWQAINDVRLAYHLTREDIERLTFAEFMVLHGLLIRGRA